MQRGSKRCFRRVYELMARSSIASLSINSAGATEGPHYGRKAPWLLAGTPCDAEPMSHPRRKKQVKPPPPDQNHGLHMSVLLGGCGVRKVPLFEGDCVIGSSTGRDDNAVCSKCSDGLKLLLNFRMDSWLVSGVNVCMVSQL